MTKTGQTVFSILALCILGAATFLTMALIAPPPPQPADSPATDFSAGRAMQDLAVIAREPRYIGISQGRAAARDYLLGEVRTLGLEPEVQETIGIRVVEPGFLIAGAVENILIRLPGTDPEGAILLMAHYDSAPGSPGALDNGTGVVAILEILRALHASPPLRQDVIFLFTDGEEAGMYGVYAFISKHPWYDRVRLAINMDTFEDGPPMLLRTSPGNGTLVQALAYKSPKPAFISLPFHLFPRDESDAVAFLNAGVPGVDIQTSASQTEKHTALDRIEMVKPAILQHTGSQVLALVRYLGDQPAQSLTAPDETYFPVLGKLVHYPTGWAMPLAILACVCFLGTMYYGFQKRDLTWRGLSLGFLTLLFSIVLSVGLTNLLWRGIQALHPAYAYSAYRLRLSNDYLYAVGFFVLALSVATLLIAIVRKRITAFDLAAGAVLFWFPATIAAMILVPATSYLATWGLLSGSLALLLALVVQSRKDAWVLAGLGFLVSAILGTFLWVPVIYIAFLGSSFPLLWLMVGVAALWLGTMLPALDWITGPKRWPLPAAALVVALGFLLAGHFLVGRDSPPPLVNGMGYWLDANNGEAYWIAGSEELDERQTSFLVDPVKQPYTDLFPEAPLYSVLTSSAPLLALDGPHLEVIEDEWVADHRMMKIRVTTSMHDRVYIVIPEVSPLLAITIPKNERTELPPVDGEEWVLRFDGVPMNGIEISVEFRDKGPIQFLVIEERTGLPSFTGLLTQPEPGTIRTPGEFYSVYNFTAIYRSFTVP